MPDFAIDVIQSLLYGLVTGSILALGAVGISLTFSILRFSNFAHGDLLASGAYFMLLFYVLLGWPLFVAGATSILLTGALAVCVDRIFFYPLRQRSTVVLMISSFGVAFILRSLIQMIFGPHTQLLSNEISYAITFGDFRMKATQMVIVAMSLVLVTALYMFLRYTNTGRWLRAVADRPALAEMCGIPSRRVVMITWFLGGGLAAIAGLTLGFDTRVQRRHGESKSFSLSLLPPS